ncbi:hypothetical protein AHAS_Ahas18G0155400 [Arachis hypogaea]
MASSHNVTGGVYKAQERIHRRMADRQLLAILASTGGLQLTIRTEDVFLELAHARGITILCPDYYSTCVTRGIMGHDDLTSSSPFSGLSLAVCLGFKTSC